jgi:hypothetical protein
MKIKALILMSLLLGTFFWAGADGLRPRLAGAGPSCEACR